jgi:hypothetical protein
MTNVSSGNTTVTGTMKTLVVEGTSNITFNGNTELLIIKANATVAFGNKASIGKIIVEDGGTTSFLPQSAVAVWPPGTDVTTIFVMPGGNFLNTATGQNNSVIDIYAYASDDPLKIATVQIGKMNVRNIVIQPSDSELGSYSANIGNPSSLTFVQGGVIHMALGYSYGGTVFGMNNFNLLPPSLLSHVCNPVGTGIRQSEAPFCPHFLALNEPPVITNTDSWSSGGFFEE